jgi:WD40 repeat protein/mono/diheme cytochrome c family protein
MMSANFVPSRNWIGRLLLFAALMLPTLAVAAEGEEKPVGDENETVSFYRQVRPILQRSCSGCHQPAKLGGKLLLTSFEGLKQGGENGAGFEPGDPDGSTIMLYITGEEPEMPLKGDPLTPEQIAVIGSWIKQGAKNDTPPSAVDTITAENPHKYVNPPVITALAYSPDSQLLAVSGYHETLVHHADGSELVGRLVGRSQRIESLSFSPDGKMIGAVGGTPALFGEIQFWNVADRKLVSSITMTPDTLFGGCFNDKGDLFAFGAADNRARVIQVKDGKQIMRLDAHSDWVLNTTFSRKSDHLISVSRDMSMKLTIVETAQFVDNITSITPGALKGGLMAVQRHPMKEQVLTGGSDGQPNLYKIFRTRKRIIGDNFNHIRSFQKLPGRIFDMQFNKDGSMFVVGSSSAISGAARIYKTGSYDETKTNNDGGLQQTRVETNKRSAEKMLVHELEGISGPVFAVAFRPDGVQVAVGGFDGHVRLFDVATGKLVKDFVVTDFAGTTTAAK